jgi:hypothetical protein
MFQLNADEFRHLKSQIVTSSWSGIRRAAPYAFAEQGVEMLSSVLNSKRAILVNIAIIRAFVRLREILAGHQELAERFKELEEQVGQNTADIETVSRIIQQVLKHLQRGPRNRSVFRRSRSRGRTLPRTSVKQMRLRTGCLPRPQKRSEGQDDTMV